MVSSLNFTRSFESILGLGSNCVNLGLMYETTGEEEGKLLEELENRITNSKPPLIPEWTRWSEALSVCDTGGLADRRVRMFLEKCLEKIVAACVELTDRTDVHCTILRYCGSQIGKALALDFSPWAGRSLILLLNLKSGHAALDRCNNLLAQCTGDVSTEVMQALQGRSLQDILLNWCPGEQVNQLKAVLLASNMHENQTFNVPSNNVKSMATRLLDELNVLSFEKVPVVLTVEGSGKQMCTSPR